MFWTPQYRRKICQIPQYCKKNCQIPQYYNTVSKLDVILKPLHCTLSLEQITRKLKLTFGNVRFRQNKQNKEHPVMCWLIILIIKTRNETIGNWKRLEKRLRTWRRIFYPVHNAKKPHPTDLENTTIPQFKIKITEIPQEKLSNTAIPQTPMSPSSRVAGRKHKLHVHVDLISASNQVLLTTLAWDALLQDACMQPIRKVWQKSQCRLYFRGMTSILKVTNLRKQTQ